MSSKTFQIGDKVKVVVPDFFRRCGYPLNVRLAEEKLITESERKILQEIFGIKEVMVNSEVSYSMDSLEFKNIIVKKPVGFDTNATKEYQAILKVLAYNKLRQNNYGGNERKIFTHFRPQLKERTFWVASKKLVKTGIREKNTNKKIRYDNVIKNSKNNIILELVDYRVMPIKPVRGNVNNSNIRNSFESAFGFSNQQPHRRERNFYQSLRNSIYGKKKKTPFGNKEYIFMNSNWIEAKNVVKVKTILPGSQKAKWV